MVRVMDLVWCMCVGVCVYRVKERFPTGSSLMGWALSY